MLRKRHPHIQGHLSKLLAQVGMRKTAQTPFQGPLSKLLVQVGMLKTQHTYFNKDMAQNSAILQN